MKKVLFVIISILALLLFFRNPIIKSVVTFGAGQVIGAKVHMDSLSLGIFKTAVSIKGLKVYNPKGFPSEPMVDVPEVSVHYDLSAILKGKLHLPEVVFDLKEFVVVKNKEGALNVDSLKVAQSGQEAQKAPVDKKEKKPAKQMAMKIDILRLNLGRVIVKDYAKGTEPSIQVFSIGVNNKVYKDITSAQQFATLIILQAMGSTAFKDAAIYGAATALGVDSLSSGVAGVLLGKKASTEDFAYSLDKVYAASLKVLKKIGTVKTADPHNAIIKGNVDGSSITIDISRGKDKKTTVKVSARKYMLPKPAVADGLLYQISEALK